MLRPSPRTRAASLAPRSAASLFAKLALAVFLPLAFFGLLELGLRLGGYGRDTEFFIRDEKPGFYRTNPRFTELVFPASFGLKPLNFRLSREKPADSYRIFVIGESAAMGVPEPAFAIAPQLQAQLRSAQPGKTIDVYNLGVTAINSHAILPIVRQAVRFQPDLLVIYMGNNEVVGPYGASSVVTDATPPLPLIRAGLWLRSTRTGQLLQHTIARLGPSGRRAKDWRGMEMFAGKTVSPDDPRLERVYANFSANLAAILELARDDGIKTVLSTVAVNVKDCSPFASPVDPALPPDRRASWQRLYDEAVVAADLGDAKRAQSLLERALSLSPRHANSHFLLARVLEQSGNIDAARHHYLEALQFDALRFRADARINRIIRTAAEASGSHVFLVDAAKELGADPASTAAPAGAEIFFEHVHYRWEGNYALVRLLATAAARALFSADSSPSTWLSSAACADALGYTDVTRLNMHMSMNELTSRPPFTGQMRFAEDRAQLQAQIKQLASALSASHALSAAARKVETALQRDPRNPSLVFQAAAVRLQSGDAAGALELNEQLSALMPPSAEQSVQKAVALQRLGRIGDAEKTLIAAATDEPFYFQSYPLLARLWAVNGQLSKALAYFKAVVTRLPDSRGARTTYAQLLAQSGNPVAAEQQLRAVLQIVPDDESALEPLIERLQKRGDGDAAIELMLAAFAYNPRSYANNARLVASFDAKGDLERTVQFMRALAASGPVNAELHHDLALHLLKLGRDDEAVAALRKAALVARDQHDDALVARVDNLLRPLLKNASNRE